MDSDEDMLDLSDSELMYDEDLYTDDGYERDEIGGDYEIDDSQTSDTSRDQVGSMRFKIVEF
jgi:hypothetical protein